MRKNISKLLNRSVKIVLLTDRGYESREKIIFSVNFIDDVGAVEFTRALFPLEFNMQRQLKKACC